ncbi:hypothetical protein WH297_14545 [Ochrobactrum vermis]|uniref:Uncharacterized protein n=1 Tax=Ochrobactrum vermis TaxID=1827297 RepID=A0ABU8PFW5_9HYPH|nr:hypothetical protein [Ochrobactrum vermis]PQZ25370.1 hypothetical protein CQZ93_14775 [Ochrobactrum vermis]
MAEQKDPFLERYFLDPGSESSIGSIYVADEDLQEIFGVEDLADAQRLFVKSLPHMNLLKGYLAGDMPPMQSRLRIYVRILLFLCWMQTTKTRQRGDREFREMLERHTGFKFSSMRGLNPMWELLRDYLAKEHGIVLDLPDIHPFSQIGRTLRIAFPTWRDKVVFRKLRQDLGPSSLLDPLQVSNRLTTSRHLLTDTMQSFEYNFDLFDRSWKQGGHEYMETPFWQAWYSVVAEHAALEELEIVAGDFGDCELFRKSPLGERKPIRSPEEASTYVPQLISRAIRSGIVLMEDMGFGRLRATSNVASNLILIHRSRLKMCDEGAIRSYSDVNAKWVLASFRSKEASTVEVKPKAREFGWLDGIRIGSALLGRSPLTPLLSARGSATVTLNGGDIAMERREDGFAFPPGTYSGEAIVSFRGEDCSVFLVPRAIEVGESLRYAFDRTKHVSEDLFHYETTPSIPTPARRWVGPRVTSCEEMITIAEALYARTARGLSFVEALEIIRRGLSRAANPPREWDILRSFSDAGWFDLTLLRSFPARRLLQRPHSVRPVGRDLVHIEGPTPLAVVEHVAACADAAGSTLEPHAGASPWALPRYVVRTTGTAAQRDFMQRVGYMVSPSAAMAELRRGDQGGVHGYHVIARLDEDSGFFRSEDADEFPEGGLYRLERNEAKSPFLYRSVVNGQPDENFESPSIAILNHHARRHRPIFRYDGSMMTAIAPRASLPASWARWAAGRNLCNAGPALHADNWLYAYPMGEEEVGALSGLVSIVIDSNKGLSWIDWFTSSASNRNRAIWDARAGKIRGSRIPGRSECH